MFMLNKISESESESDMMIWHWRSKLIQNYCKIYDKINI